MSQKKEKKKILKGELVVPKTVLDVCIYIFLYHFLFYFFDSFSIS